MKKVFYEKVGRRYIPVKEYNTEWLDSFRKGAHLIICYPGGKSVRHNIDPNYAAMIAAGRTAEDAMCQAMVKASELKPSKQPITLEQKLAWENLAKAFGQDMYTLNGTSVNDVVQAGIAAMQEEASKLLSNPAVKESYEQFLLMCELTKENHNER